MVQASESLFRWHLSGALVNASMGVGLPVVVFMGSAWALASRLQRIEEKTAGDAIEPVAAPIFPHRGLIASVSWVSEAARAPVEVAMVPAPGSGPNHREELLRSLYKTSWGPLAAAVELHRGRLKHVWLLCSPQVHRDFALVKNTIQFLAGPGVAVEEVPLADRNSVREARQKIEGIYGTLDALGLRENQVIADITSGNSAMTAGMVLASLDEQRHVQYLSQDPRESLLVDGKPRTDLTAVFRYVETSPNDVARAFIGLLQKPRT